MHFWSFFFSWYSRDFSCSCYPDAPSVSVLLAANLPVWVDRYVRSALSEVPSNYETESLTVEHVCLLVIFKKIEVPIPIPPFSLFVFLWSRAISF